MKTVFRILASTSILLVGAVVWAQAPRVGSKSYSGPGVPYMDPATEAYFVNLSARDEEACALRDQAKAAIEKGDFPNAFSLLQQAVKTYPTESESCVLLSYFYIQKGQSAEVVTTLEPIVNTGKYTIDNVGEHITTRMMYILALLDRNAWREAVACYKRSWRSDTGEVPQFGISSFTWRLGKPRSSRRSIPVGNTTLGTIPLCSPGRSAS